MKPPNSSSSCSSSVPASACRIELSCRRAFRASPSTINVLVPGWSSAAPISPNTGPCALKYAMNASLCGNTLTNVAANEANASTGISWSGTHWTKMPPGANAERIAVKCSLV